MLILRNFDINQCWFSNIGVINADSQKYYHWLMLIADSLLTLDDADSALLRLMIISITMIIIITTMINNHLGDSIWAAAGTILAALSRAFNMIVNWLL